jgi:hypothetical protein
VLENDLNFINNLLDYSHFKVTPLCSYTREAIKTSQVIKLFKTTNSSHQPVLNTHSLFSEELFL